MFSLYIKLIVMLCYSVPLYRKPVATLHFIHSDLLWTNFVPMCWRRQTGIWEESRSRVSFDWSLGSRKKMLCPKITTCISRCNLRICFMHISRCKQSVSHSLLCWFATRNIRIILECVVLPLNDVMIRYLDLLLFHTRIHIHIIFGNTHTYNLHKPFSLAEAVYSS